MNPVEAVEFAVHIFAAITDAAGRVPYPTTAARFAADYNRLARDLAVVRAVHGVAATTPEQGRALAVALNAAQVGLTETGSLYGVRG